MDGLFCEPFPNSTWILPQHFPHRNREATLPSFDTLLKDNKDSTLVPKFIYLDIERKHDKPFHCDYGQEILQKIPVLFLRSDQYFVPSLFMVEKFNPELIRMFPNKETVFHHLGRYLFHPSNQAWGLISRFFDTYLANADQRIGIQIRVFNSKNVPPQTVMNQIQACSKTYSILPEGVQRFKNEIHNVKAWAEIYLLSLCDLLVTSGQSTFGYVGQGLGDVKPWILEKQLDANIPDPPCWLGVSTEPCFHFPPEKECAAAAGRRRSGGERWNVSSKFEYLKPCEDLSFGVKLMQ
ncbi:Probable fucosyltransferase 9 [Linum perenne]